MVEDTEYQVRVRNKFVRRQVVHYLLYSLISDRYPSASFINGRTESAPPQRVWLARGPIFTPSQGYSERVEVLFEGGEIALDLGPAPVLIPLESKAIQLAPILVVALHEPINEYLQSGLVLVQRR